MNNPDVSTWWGYIEGFVLVAIAAVAEWIRRQVRLIDKVSGEIRILKERQGALAQVPVNANRIAEIDAKLATDKSRLDRFERELSEARMRQDQDHDTLIRVDERTAGMETKIGRLDGKLDDVHGVLEELLRQAKGRGARRA